MVSVRVVWIVVWVEVDVEVAELMLRSVLGGEIVDMVVEVGDRSVIRDDLVEVMWMKTACSRRTQATSVVQKAK